MNRTMADITVLLIGIFLVACGLLTVYDFSNIYSVVSGSTAFVVGLLMVAGIVAINMEERLS